LAPAAKGKRFVAAAQKCVRLWQNTDVTERKVNEQRQRQAQGPECPGLLAGGMAHDFNNLLTGIMRGASLASSDVAEPKLQSNPGQYHE
jgi:hypothetical protein